MPHVTSAQVVTESSGFSVCVQCKSGSHNPDPSKFKCACKPGHEPHNHGGCEPCKIGHYKAISARSSAKCSKCPSLMNHTEDVGSIRCDWTRVRAGGALILRLLKC